MNQDNLNRLNRVIERFSDNYKGFFPAFYPLILVFTIGILCDAFSTIYFMLKDGVSNELHPAVLYVSIILGPVMGPLFGAVAKIFAGIMVAVYLKKYAVYILISASVISLFAAWYNVWG